MPEHLPLDRAVWGSFLTCPIVAAGVMGAQSGRGQRGLGSAVEQCRHFPRVLSENLDAEREILAMSSLLTVTVLPPLCLALGRAWYGYITRCPCLPGSGLQKAGHLAWQPESCVYHVTGTMLTVRALFL